jgi:tetratricopeptide (TPR) repeat protein
LNVEGIVEGTVMRVGDRVRITVQLIDARVDKHLWAERFDRDLRDVLVLQSEIARSVASEIRIALTPEEGRRLSSAGTVNPKAHEAYLRGRYFWNKRSSEGLRRAIGYFDSAIDVDPSYAAAYAGLADSYALLPGYSTEPATEAMPRAESAARRALELDESLAEAHASLAFVRAFYHWDWPGAEQSCRRALELDPRSPKAHHWYGLILAATGRSREALAELERAHELDPLSRVISRNLGSRLIGGDLERSIELLLHTIELDPELPLAHLVLARAYQEQGEEEKALAIAAHQLNDYEAAYIYAYAGRREDALRRLQQAEDGSERAGDAALYKAQAYAALGDEERAFEWLERAYAARELALGLMLKTEAAFVPLHDDPRFQDLLRRMGLPEN